jgi:uncharacterized protein YfaS (alpha-2-macroglobulin family)
MFLRKLLLVLFTGMSLTGMSQTKNNYNSNWKKVEGFELKGLTKSALAEVLVIYKLAVKDNNDAQQIKSCMYQVKYRNMVEDDSHENNIFFLDTLISNAKAPAKNILQSMQAEVLWKYLQNNRWKFYDRTKLTEEKNKDISTWSMEKIHAVITKLYKSSLQNDALLKSTALDAYDPIIIKGTNTQALRPTLFDFLAHRALEYFMSDEHDLNKPSYAFTISETAAFADAASFVKHNFKTKDSSSLQHKALLLFQSILQFHLQDTKPDALIDADLIRLDFVNTYGTIDNKKEAYEAALKNIETKYATHPGAAQAGYLRALMYKERGEGYSPDGNTTHQYEIKRAKELCDSIITKFAGSEGAVNCKNMLQIIERPELTIKAEKVNLINEPFRALVQYTNIPKLYLRIIPVTHDDIIKLNKSAYDQIWKNYTALKALKSWSINLPDLKDFQQHKTEIKIDALPRGTYIILASADEHFKLEKNILCKQIIHVSNISFLHNDNREYYVLHRDNGQPLANTQVQVWESKYNYQKSMQEEIKAEKYTTDKNGMFKMKVTNDYRSFFLQLKHESDELFINDNESYSSNNSNTSTTTEAQTFLFTDRSIYRPGQTVYFKGIVIQKNADAKKTAVLPNFKTKVLLMDANFQKAAELTVSTNSYGSYKGSFTLPAGLMNGVFRLQDSVTRIMADFSVEEYKRPKFTASIEKPKGTYRLNDSITVTGTAKALAGNLIDGAKVKYRVVRKVQYPVWSGFSSYYRGGFRNNDETEIANGESVTDTKGEFNIKFKAIPDATVAKADQPVFYYEVSADVTDINGETRSANTSVAVAYQALQLNIVQEEKLPADSFKKLTIRSTNMNDIFETAEVNVSVTKVQSPNKIFRERYWGMPDQFVMSADEYHSVFPYDIYKDEDQISNWPLKDKVADITDSTKENSAFNFQHSKFEAGWYKIVATTKDKYGELVKAEKYIQLTAPSANTQIFEAIRIEGNKDIYKPGEKINYTVATGFDKVWMIHTLKTMDQKGSTTFPLFEKNTPQQFSYDVRESSRGGMMVNYAFVQHNRVYTTDKNFDMPWSNKELQISYATFRDKLLPGANEKFTVHITGEKGDKVAAEMLAGMYDASLDEFKPHGWGSLDIWPSLNTSDYDWQQEGFEEVESESQSGGYDDYKEFDKAYDKLGIKNLKENVVYEWLDIDKAIQYRSAKLNAQSNRLYALTPPPAASFYSSNASTKIEFLKFTAPKIVDDGYLAQMDKNAYDSAGFVFPYSTAVPFLKIADEKKAPPIQVRKNFNETAFFFPNLETDSAGNISFSFTMPEALTKWKLMTLAHTKELASAYNEKTLITQKPLMVQPNPPRFLREGDAMEFSAKIVNMGDSEITGTAQLELIDAATNKPVDGWFKNIFPNQYFTIAAGQSSVVKFPMEVPFNFNSAMTYRIIAKTNTASDGEEMAIPVLSNRMLVTESMPLNLRGVHSKPFKFEKLLNSENSNSITNHALTVEYTSNPAWYAVQALPYLMEYPYECAEQTFNRYYANVLAAYISNASPKIKAVFEKWKTVDTAALLSNLQKNEELKSALLQETPWVLEAQNESQQKKNIALLFDMVKMSAETDKAFTTLKNMQSSNGGFVWFKGGPDDRYITQYIITGIGHLRKLNALTGPAYQKIKPVVDNAILYLDKKIQEDYDNLLRYKAVLKTDQLGNLQIQYLYMRSFFPEYKIADASVKAFTYYRTQSQKFWLNKTKYMQAMIALGLHRTKDAVLPKAIIKSLKENAINKEELGMYWKEWTNGGYYWQQAPIESQAMMIEAFTDIDKNNTTIDDLKTWLLKQKQTQNWKTTKATAEACYALLLNGNDWLTEEKEVTVNLGNSTIKSTDNGTEAGTGYFKNSIEGAKVKPEMGNIIVTLNSSSPKPLNQLSTSWGAVYWQYFEDLDKITSAETPLKLKKQLFIERNSDKGPVLEAITDGAQLKVGDKIKVRIELKADRDMEYVHMKDLRAACMEPVNVLSEYKYQGGLGYYESTKDASTNFFFNYLNRGTYVFEYPLFVTHAGNFSNGITTIQCMYAPEFSAHSEGIRVIVE